MDANFTSPFERRSFLWNHCLTVLPAIFQSLLSQKTTPEGFSHQLIKLFLHLYENKFVDSSAIRKCLLQVFSGLANVKTFQKTSVWANVASVLML